MLAQKFAISTKQRLDNCRECLNDFSTLNRVSFSSLNKIQQELNALEGEAQLLNFHALNQIIDATLESMDTSTPDLVLKPDTIVVKIERGLESILILLRLWMTGKSSARVAQHLAAYVRDLTPFPEELESANVPHDSPKRILLIDDSEITREIIQFSLESEGHEVAVTGDLLSFDQILSEFHPNIILADVNMPDIQGDQICRALKSKHETNNIPIILFSSLSEDQLSKLAERAGADGYASKQDGVESLIQQINEVIYLVLW